MSKQFKVWIDGNSEKNTVETDFGIIEAENMNEALDKAAQMAGYIDHADIAQELGWEESEFNVLALEDAYINFFPGDMKSEREISVSEDAAYGMAQDLGDFLESMLSGCTASISADGVKAALEDGALLGQIVSDYGIEEGAMQEVVEELHAAL